jgi:hypothetical protein
MSLAEDERLISTIVPFQCHIRLADDTNILSLGFPQHLEVEFSLNPTRSGVAKKIRDEFD